MGSIPNSSSPLQACARQIFESTQPGRTRRRKFGKVDNSATLSHYSDLASLTKGLKCYRKKLYAISILHHSAFDS